MREIIKAEELQVGDALIRVLSPSWGDGYELVQHKVEKILQTQLVLRDERGRELRVRIRDGFVTSDEHGSGRSLYPHVDLRFPTDPALEYYRALQLRGKSASRVRKAIDGFNLSRNDIEKTRELRDALETHMKVLRRVESTELS